MVKKKPYQAITINHHNNNQNQSTGKSKLVKQWAAEQSVEYNIFSEIFLCILCIFFNDNDVLLGASVKWPTLFPASFDILLIPIVLLKGWLEIIMQYDRMKKKLWWNIENGWTLQKKKNREH